MYLRSEFENRKGVEFDYTRTGGLSCFALGKKRNAKFCYLRFESAHIDNENVKTRFVALYLLKTPKNDYKVPVIKGITAHQSYHGFEFYTLRLFKENDFSDGIKNLVEDSFATRNNGEVIKEKRTKPELRELAQKDIDTA